mgnify:CR=1 FL=1
MDDITQIDIEIAACEQAIRDAYAIRDVEVLSKRIQVLSRKRKELEECALILFKFHFQLNSF